MCCEMIVFACGREKMDALTYSVFGLPISPAHVIRAPVAPSDDNNTKIALHT